MIPPQKAALMNEATPEPTNASAGNGNAALRRSVYALLIAIGIGVYIDG